MRKTHKNGIHSYMYLMYIALSKVLYNVVNFMDPKFLHRNLLIWYQLKVIF